MMTFQCPTCKHYNGTFTCDAYPDRIPDEILTGEYDHTEPFEGDNGIQYEPIEVDADEN